MIILGIETSCDETAASVVEDGTKILSNLVSSSQELHIKTGGIIPEVAAREQIKFIILVIEQALKNGCGWVMSNGSANPTPTTHPRLITHNSTPPPIDAISVTIGPGLIGSLLVGVETAKTLAYAWDKPLVPVNHLLSHIYANWLSLSPQPTLDPQPTTHPFPQFPVLCLIVSGGHTELLLMKGHGKFKWLGGTRDDAAGEAFDKIARLLGLGYPGGPTIAAEAGNWKMENGKWKIKLPRPMIDSNDFDFSFSGLKTAVLREVKKLTTHDSPLIPYLAYETQEAITDVLVEKTIRAAQKHKVNSILLAGGVAANQRLREKMKFKIENLKLKIDLFIPPPQFCTDNAAGVASCAFFNFKPLSWRKTQAEPSLIIS